MIIFVGCHKKQIVESQSITSSNDAMIVDSDIVTHKQQIKSFSFEPISNKEILEHEIWENDDGVYLNIYAASNGDNRELLIFPIAYSRNYEDEIQYSVSRKRMVFGCKPNAPDIFELWFLDGKSKGAIYLMNSIYPYDFKIDDECKIICVYNGYESQDVPILFIYDIDSMQELKRIQYEPYRNKGMYPVEMSYQDGAFSVILSADTVDFTTIEIPVEGPEQYRVVESYSWEEENNRQNY
jgi:hypothetical protein